MVRLILFSDMKKHLCSIIYIQIGARYLPCPYSLGAAVDLRIHGYDTAILCCFRKVHKKFVGFVYCKEWLSSLNWRL